MDNELFIVRYYWSLFRRHPLQWLLPMLIVIAVGTVVVLQMPPSYLSVARVVAQSPQVSGSLVQSTVRNEGIQFFEERVFSRENLVALADKLNLVARGTLTDGQVAEVVRRHITVNMVATGQADPAGQAATMLISFQAGTPQLAAAGANEVIQMFIVENRNSRMSEASQLRTFLEQEVGARRLEAENLDAEWNVFVSTNESLLPSRLPIYTSEMQQLQQELQTIEVASTSLAADTRVIQTQLALANHPTSVEGNQLAELREELSTKLTVLSDAHPEIVSLRARIATLEGNLTNTPPTTATLRVPTTAQSAEEAMLNERLSAANEQQETFSLRRAQISDRLSWLRSTIAQMPSVEARLLALQRRHAMAMDNLADMENRLNTARVGERLENAQQDSQISIIDKPEVPIYATGGGRARALLIVAAIGLAAGIVCLVLLDFLNRTIKSKRDLAPMLEGASLVLIPEWKPRRKRLSTVSLAMLFISFATVQLADDIGSFRSLGAEMSHELIDPR